MSLRRSRSPSGTGSGPFALSNDLKIAKLQQKTEIYAKKHGKDVLLASFYVQNRDVITWDQVPASVKNATLGAEDPRSTTTAASTPWASSPRS